MLLARYLGKEKMELLKREVESLTGIRLKTIAHWLIHKSRLQERQDLGNNRGSVRVITVANSSETSYLCTNGLRFGEGLKVVERCWEVGPESVCPIYCGADHDRLRNYGERDPQCILFAGPHRLNQYKCGVNGYQSGSGSHLAI